MCGVGCTYIGLGPMAAGYTLWTRAMAGGGADRLGPIGDATLMLSTALLLVAGAPAGTGTLVGVALVVACSLGVLAHDRQRNAQAGSSTCAGSPLGLVVTASPWLPPAGQGPDR